MRFLTCGSAALAVLLAGCGSSSDSTPPGFSGLSTGTAANEVSSIKLTGELNEASDVEGQGYDLVINAAAAMTPVADAAASTTGFSITMALDGTHLPEDPGADEALYYEIATDSTVTADSAITYFELEAER